MKNKSYLVSGLILSLSLAFVSGCYMATRDFEYTDYSPIARPTFAPLPDFKSEKDIKQKKKAFFAYLLPMIEYANQKIQLERERLVTIADKKSPSQPDINYLKRLTDKYEEDPELPSDQLTLALLKKIDTIPPSLVLAQAANESAWGTSRFARKANNLFGQWCFKKGCGLVPKHRKSGSKHEVRKFISPLASVENYMLNINYHRAYNSIREIRQTLRDQQSPVTGEKLATGLINYSERREAYVDEIKNMIRFNKLEDLTRQTSPSTANSSTLKSSG